MLWWITTKSEPIFKALSWRFFWGSSWLWSYDSWIYNYLCNQCLSPLMLWVRISIRARCTTLCDKVCQWFATGRWFSPGPTLSSTNKTDRHDITEILLKVAWNTIKQTQILCQFWRHHHYCQLVQHSHIHPDGLLADDHFHHWQWFKISDAI